jgi:hypothetical protein
MYASQPPQPPMPAPEEAIEIPSATPSLVDPAAPETASVGPFPSSFPSSFPCDLPSSISPPSSSSISVPSSPSPPSSLPLPSTSSTPTETQSVAEEEDDGDDLPFPPPSSPLNVPRDLRLFNIVRVDPAAMRDAVYSDNEMVLQAFLDT